MASDDDIDLTKGNDLEVGDAAPTSTNRHGSLESTGNHQLEVFHQHRPILFALAYRMLGSAADAEDLLQETYIRWQERSELGVQSPRAFLVTIVTRLCINHLQSARVKREEYFGPWLPEPLLTAPPIRSCRLKSLNPFRWRSCYFWNGRLPPPSE